MWFTDATVGVVSCRFAIHGHYSRTLWNVKFRFFLFVTTTPVSMKVRDPCFYHFDSACLLYCCQLPLFFPAHSLAFSRSPLPVLGFTSMVPKGIKLQFCGPSKTMQNSHVTKKEFAFPLHKICTPVLAGKHDTSSFA